VLGDDAVVDVTAFAADPARHGSEPTEYGIGIRTTSGAIATIALSYGSRFEVADLMVITDTESWHISGADLRTAGGPIGGGTFAAAQAAAQAAAVRAQDAAFLAACRGDAPFRASAAAVLPTLRIQQRVADLLDR
jgi:hypothetical protein